MRKSLVIILSLLMVCALAGCGSNNASGDHLERSVSVLKQSLPRVILTEDLLEYRRVLLI